MVDIFKAALLFGIGLFSVSCSQSEIYAASVFELTTENDSDCVLPVFPDNGRYSIPETPDAVNPGAVVPSKTILHYQCDAGYEVYAHSTAVCVNGNWETEFKECRSNGCVVPDPPASGSYSIVGSSEAPIPGAAVAEKEALRYNCTTKNGCLTDQVIVCSNGEWLPGVVECDYLTGCEDVLGDESGVYVIKPTTESEPFEVYCDLSITGQKWTVIQQRLSEEVDFFRNYTEYSEGFGKAAGNHWLGLQHIHEITKDGNHELLVELGAYNGTTAYAGYDIFSVGNCSTGYQLSVSGYNGTAGDAMTLTLDGGRYSANGMKFTTYDNDQDFKPNGNCAVERQGAWWFNHCGYCNLNSLYDINAQPNYTAISWYQMFDGYVALKTSRMLVRKR